MKSTVITNYILYMGKLNVRQTCSKDLAKVLVIIKKIYLPSTRIFVFTGEETHEAKIGRVVLIHVLWSYWST